MPSGLTCTSSPVLSRLVTQTASVALSILSGPVLLQTYCWRSLTLIIVTLGRLHSYPSCKHRQTHLDLLYESLKTQEWHFTNFNGITSLIFQHWEKKKKCLDYNTLPSSQNETWRERGFGVGFNLRALCFSGAILHNSLFPLCFLSLWKNVLLVKMNQSFKFTHSPPPLESSYEGGLES